MTLFCPRVRSFLHGQGSVLMGIGYGVGMTPKGMDNSGLAKQHKNVPRNTARKIIRDVMDKFVKGEERLVLCKALQCGRNMECHCQPIRERLHLPNGVPCSKAIGTVALPKVRGSWRCCFGPWNEAHLQSRLAGAQS